SANRNGSTPKPASCSKALILYILPRCVPWSAKKPGSAKPSTTTHRQRRTSKNPNVHFGSGLAALGRGAAPHGDPGRRDGSLLSRDMALATKSAKCRQPSPLCRPGAGTCPDPSFGKRFEA